MSWIRFKLKNDRTILINAAEVKAVRFQVEHLDSAQTDNGEHRDVEAMAFTFADISRTMHGWDEDDFETREAWNRFREFWLNGAGGQVVDLSEEPVFDEKGRVIAGRALPAGYYPPNER